MTPRLSRRSLLGAASALGLTWSGSRATAISVDTRPAVLGGTPVRTASFPRWPIFGDEEISALVDVLRSGAWYRGSGNRVEQFESAWADRLGSKHCVATANGTSALITSLNALDVGPGDEVIVPPYTFVATINAILIQHALPVFVDVDPETSQIDPSKIEAAITDRTRALMPVHIGGSPADMDAIMAIASKHGLPVIEDACQSHLAEWRGKKVGTIGDLGCFSFQASKNLNSGEGGAVMTQDPRLQAECMSFQNNGRSGPGMPGIFARNGANLRLTEFQGALLMAQMTRLDAQSKLREENASILTEQLNDIPGVTPARMYEGCTRNAYHLYMFRYDPDQFSGLSRSGFLKALAAEGIPASGGYGPLYHEPFLRRALDSRGFRAVYSPQKLADYEARIDCPGNDQLCQEAVWLTQTTLLGNRQDMDQIATAIRKIREHAGTIAAL
ncbi:DegT/DnrJ/EryC1/StrS family aminotransferase [Tautonia rosea]|uniref:DegT/DnrJ/EryC1/StrS family aminotransferase n=1 Tax=Tautonia rosea TaxID=2728037 RepID=UPI0014733BF3|nr:DegT/DnrJ/EryC1/StrS family aminotransferase [Tautonia rosea]